MISQETALLLVRNSFSITINANDFFGWATSDEIEIGMENYSWVCDIIDAHGNPGLNAAMAYIAERMPMKEHISPEFMTAYCTLIKLKPKVYSSK